MSEEATMQDKKNRAVADRRRFLKLAGAGVATAGGALAADAAPAKASDTRKSDGPLYRETEHIRKYYELARD
jgi:hypothetical protein